MARIVEEVRVGIERDCDPGMAELGINAAEEDFILGKPAVLLKPVCIFK